MTERTRRIESVAAPLAVCALALLFVLGAWQLRGDAGRFPILVGSITAVLAIVEAVIRATAAQVYGVPPGISGAAMRRGTLLMLWFAASLGGLYLLGVVIATAVFTAIYFRIFAGWTLSASLVAGLAQSALFWIAFQALAGFRLHEGVLIKALH